MNDDVIDTAFTASTYVSGALFIVNVFAVAPLSSWIYHSERVGVVTALVGLSFVFTPTVSISRALLFRQRNYRVVTITRIGSTAASLVIGAAVLLASPSVWALVAQIVSAQALLAVAMYLTTERKPQLRFASGAFREMIGYSGLVFANDLFVSAARNFDVITLGQLMGQSEVGLYSLAFYITDVARLNIMSVLNRVMFTHYAKIQNNLALVRFYYVRTLSWNTLIIFPVMISIILAGPVLLPVCFGAAWDAMGLPLQILAVSVMIHASGGTTSTLYKALGRPGLDLLLFVLTSVVFLLPAIVIGVRWHGVVGASIAVASNKLISALIRQVLLDRMIGATLGRVAGSLAGALLAQLPILVIWLVGMSLLTIDVPIRAAFSTGLGLLAYCLTILLLQRTNSAIWPAFDNRPVLAGA